MSIKNLSQSDFSEIKRLLDDGTEQALIAKKFGITQSDVSQIKTGKHYGGGGNYPMLWIPGISNKTKEVLKNIAANKNMKYGAFLRYEIQKLIDNTPDHLKRPPLDY